MTAEQIITLLRSHFCLLSLTENIKTEINNYYCPVNHNISSPTS